MKYSEYPVSYFYGLPQIELPLYELKEGTLSLPITMSYHGGGIKVDESDGNLGLGWTLQAAGAISRSIYGLPDDLKQAENRGFFYQTTKDKELRNYIRSKIEEYDPLDTKLTFQKTNLETINSLITDYEKGHIDIANDIFRLSCLGMSATFIYDDAHKIVTSTSSAIEIEQDPYGAPTPSQYIVTDENGSKYYFSKHEYTRYALPLINPYIGQTPDSTKYISAWHLTKIKNTENDSIIISYNPIPKSKIIHSTGSGYWYTCNSIELDKMFFGEKGQWSSSNITYYPQTIKSISSSSAIVEFSYDESMEHVIAMKVVTNDDHRNVIKNLNFRLSNFPNTHKTSKLDEVIDKGISGTLSTVLYSFAYYSENGKLPFKWDQIDHGGFYNGIENGDNIFPPLDRPLEIARGADRSVNAKNCILGSLKSITYPTSGKTIFDWEPNEFGYIKNTQVSDTVITIVNCVDSFLCGLSHGEKLMIKDYRVNTSKIYLNLSNYFSSLDEFICDWKYYNLSHSGIGTDYTYPRVVFHRLQDQGYGVIDSVVYYIDKQTISKEDIPLGLKAGRYNIYLKSPRGFEGATGELMNRFTEDYDYDFGRVIVRSKSTIGSAQGMKKDYWPGLRIRSIFSVANDGDSIEKRYEYTIAHEPHTSKGVICKRPNYYSYYDFIGLFSLSATSMVNKNLRAHRLSSSGLYHTPLSVQNVEYPYVVEQFITGGSKAEPNFSHNIIYKYSSMRTPEYNDYISTKWHVRQPTSDQMWTSMAHYRGNLLSKSYNSTGELSQIVINYKYNILEDPTPHKFTTSLFQLTDFKNLGSNHTKDYSIGEYQLIPYNKTIKQEENIEYDASNSSYQLISTVNYTYFYNEYTNKNDYKLIRSKKTTNSLGEIVETFYTYRYVNDSYINTPETEVTVSGGKIIAAKRMVYENNNVLHNKLVAVYGLSLRGQSSNNYSLGANKETNQTLIALINKPEYNYRYDCDGNLAEIRYNGEVLASYLWGYRGTYPIVEAKGATYEQLLTALQSTGYSTEGLLSATGASVNYSALFSSIRNNLAEYDVTTMTYHWLIGVSTATDSRGITTHFTFDDFGRLSDVKDYNQYFIRKYDYNYKGQN